MEPDMKSAWTRTICRVLAALMIWTPVQLAQAGMIGTEHAVSSASHADRGTLLGFVARADVAGQLQALGIDPAAARGRVAALSDQEAQSLAGRINSLPAGADASGIVVLILFIVGLWWFWRM
jgi:hypothetical protein